MQIQADIETRNINVKTKYTIGQEVYVVSKKPQSQKVTCPICDGAQILIYRNPEEDWHIEKQMECPECHGYGTIQKHMDGYHVSGTYTIKSFSVRVTEDEVFVRYNLSSYGALEEDKIFATYEEAVKACEKLQAEIQ